MSGEPHVVFLKSLFWDLRILSLTWPGGLANLTTSPQALVTLAADVETRARAAIRQLRALFPSAVVALRSDPCYNTTASRFVSEGGRRKETVDSEAVHALALRLLTAQKRAAALEGVSFVDLWGLFAPLTPNIYLEDDIHPSSHYSRLAMDLLVLVLGRRDPNIK